jgi:hypothetical protein
MVPRHGPFAYSGPSSLRTSASASASAGIRRCRRLEGLSCHWQCPHWRGPHDTGSALTGRSLAAAAESAPPGLVHASEQAPPTRWRVRAIMIARGASPSCQPECWMLAQQWNCTMAGARGIRRPRDLQPRPRNPQLEFPSPRFPIWPGTGRELPIPDSAGNGNREIPRFPDSAGNGNRGPDWPQIGKSGDTLPCE